MTNAGDFRKEIKARFAQGVTTGAAFVDVTSGDVHRAVGGYPGANHKMPVCCDVMYAESGKGDVILSAPPKGKGATLTIHYRLPR